MFLDVEYSVLLVSKPLCRIVSAEPLDERDGSLGDVTRELDVVDAAQDDVVDLHRVACGKRRTEIVQNVFFEIKIYFLCRLVYVFFLALLQAWQS